MGDTFSKTAKNDYLNAIISDLKINNLREIDIDKFNSDAFKFLILQTPVQTRNDYYFKTKKDYGLNNKNTDTFLKQLCNILNIGTNFYPFSAFLPKPENLYKKHNLMGKLHSSKHYMALYVNNSIIDSLFCSLRDALAHGNILQNEHNFYIFSSQKLDNNNSRLKFVLCIDKICRLFEIKDLLLQYENRRKVK